MTATTIEQSRHLLELGLDPSTADMFYFSYGMFRPMKLHVGKILEDVVTGKRQWAIPAWSLSALLDVMPNNDYWEICLWQYKDQRWQCVFDDVEFSNGETKAFVADAPIDTAYEMVCWLLENNLIKKGGNDE